MYGVCPHSIGSYVATLNDAVDAVVSDPEGLVDELMVRAEAATRPLITKPSADHAAPKEGANLAETTPHRSFGTALVFRCLGQVFDNDADDGKSSVERWGAKWGEIVWSQSAVRAYMLDGASNGHVVYDY